MADAPTPDPRFLGGQKGMVVTNANDKAFVLVVGWDGAVDMQANVDKPQMATILRQIADQLAPAQSAKPTGEDRG